MLASTVIFIMLAAFLLIGGIAARKVRGGTHTDLIVAGRSMPLLLALLTMTATWVDGGYLLGTAEGAYKSSFALAVQGGLCFGCSLILGGLVFAGPMRRLGFTTLIDPFESRYGKHWAIVLFTPAMLAEVFWSAELLAAMGSSFAALLGVKLVMAILLSAIVVTAYTMAGGLWSVAYTDLVQLGLVALGLLAALPFVLGSVGGLHAGLASYTAYAPLGASLIPHRSAWGWPATVSWWDVSMMLMLGGIPWNCYFQRVLSCKSPRQAQSMSILSGLLTIAFVVPPLLIGMAALSFPWPAELAARLKEHPSETLPLMLRQATPAWVALLGLGAIVGAVTSSFSSSVLSAASMFSWNCCKRLLLPKSSIRQMKSLIRYSVLAFGAGALLMALRVQSVQELWFFTSDLVFVLLFPQLVFAIFDSKSNRIGSMTAFFLSLVLRLGGGEPLLGLKPFIHYPELFAGVLPGRPQDWYDASTGAMLFPFKTLAAAVGFVVLPIVSRLTTHWKPAQRLANLAQDEALAAGAPETA
ncbi:MAG TPA: sodium:solute symporter family protein [Bryobacteraceae bacterium]